jgi:flagellar protein FlaJ
LLNLRNKKDEIDPHYLFMATFSLALFSSGFPVEEVLHRLGSQQYFSPYDGYYKRISNLVSGYGFKISAAVTNTLKLVGVTPFKQFLIRFSQAISYGDNLVDFLSRELETESTIFRAVNERKQEGMNTFLALYGTLNSALVFLIVDITILSVLYNLGASFVVLLSVAVSMVSVLMTLVVYVLYKPYAKMIFPRHGYAMSVAALVSSAVLITVFRTPLTIFVSGVGLLCLGIYFKLNERTIDRIERDYLVFVRYFTRTFDVVGTLKHSLLSVLRGELGTMRDIVKRMQVRSDLGVDKIKIFRIMGEETKSHMVLMGNAVLASTLEAGGNIGYVGEKLSSLMEMLLNIRGRREQNGKTFETTVYILQGTSAAVGGALISIVDSFVKLFSSLATYSIFNVGNANIPEVEFLVLMILVLLSYTNGFAVSIAYGKPMATSVFYIGLLLALTLVSYEAALLLTNSIFSSITLSGQLTQPPTQ